MDNTKTVLVSTDEFQERDFQILVASSQLNGKAVHIGLNHKTVLIRVRDNITGETHEHIEAIDKFVEAVLTQAEENRVQNLLQEQAG